MNPSLCSRDHLHRLTDLPNVGEAIARSLELLGIRTPGELAGQDPLDLYLALCRQRGARQDPCLLDVLLSISRFLAGAEARPWWTFTAERKQRYPHL